MHQFITDRVNGEMVKGFVLNDLCHTAFTIVNAMSTFGANNKSFL